ncbi:hypothetical protein HTZ97_09240 [Desulfuromonas acetoxidans]|nr:hypothetical protein [Desulfuromonas acetoxidans]MBF0646381.1 hypothetical protein [Desulfuromonas acetoxidans]NVD24404.1 hypothetical protein [Desulfuromonas acetoxidans]NVE16648.1 hypothetical protein [Desulfuromonas acetoxidans]
MKNVILTEGNQERLKILSFLFRVSGYTIEVIQDLGRAMASYQGLSSVERQSSLLVVADYHHLGHQRELRFEKLTTLAQLEPSAVLLAAYRWTEPEQLALVQEVPQGESFLMCQSHQIIDFVERHCAAQQCDQQS